VGIKLDEMKPCHALIVSLMILAVVSCKGPQKPEEGFVPTKQQKAEDAIKSWMLKSNEYPYYKPIVFGELTPRYERTDRVFQISMLVQEEMAKSPEGSARLDSLKNLQNQDQGNLLGYIILHKYSTKNMAGEIINNENLFFLDSSFRVASVLNPESFDMILNEKPFYKLDSIE
jgi:hypothetical protein